MGRFLKLYNLLLENPNEIELKNKDLKFSEDPSTSFVLFESGNYIKCDRSMTHFALYMGALAVNQMENAFMPPIEETFVETLNRDELEWLNEKASNGLDLVSPIRAINDFPIDGRMFDGYISLWIYDNQRFKYLDKIEEFVTNVLKVDCNDFLWDFTNTKTDSQLTWEQCKNRDDDKEDPSLEWSDDIREKFLDFIDDIKDEIIELMPKSHYDQTSKKRLKQLKDILASPSSASKHFMETHSWLF